MKDRIQDKISPNVDENEAAEVPRLNLLPAAHS